jgi:hypothetical protein
MTYEFFNDWHLGDGLFQCLYFHRVAPQFPKDEFIFYCRDEHQKQLAETLEHLPNACVSPLKFKTPQAINCWMGRGEYWHKHPNRNAMLPFWLEWYGVLSRDAGLPNPFKTVDDLWWDFPSIDKPTPCSQPYDFLVVNAAPLSGQFHYNHGEMNALVGLLRDKGHTVITTNPSLPDVPCTLDHGISVSGIGNVSNFCAYHLMVSTGPSWLTWNTRNVNRVKLRMILLDHIKLDYGPNCHHFGYIQGAANFLVAQKLL